MKTTTLRKNLSISPIWYELWDKFSARGNMLHHLAANARIIYFLQSAKHYQFTTLVFVTLVNLTNFLNLSKLVWHCLNLSEIFQFCLKLFKLVWNCSNLFELVWNFSNLPKIVQTFLKLFQLVWKWSNWYKPVQYGLDLVKLV